MLCIIYTRPQLCALQANEKNTDPCPEEAAGGAHVPSHLSLIPPFTHMSSLTTVARLTQAKCLPLSETSHTMMGHLVGSSLQKYLCAYLECLAESEISGREGSICRKMRHSFPGYTSTPKKNKYDKGIFASTVKLCPPCFWLVPGCTLPSSS